MILRRVIAHVKKREWTAIAAGFILSSQFSGTPIAAAKLEGLARDGRKRDRRRTSMGTLFMSAALSAAMSLASLAGAAGGEAQATDEMQAAAPIAGSFSTLPRERLSPDIVRQALHGENLTLSRWELKAGAKVPMHKHASEQISLILSGRAEATSGGKKYALGPGDFLLFPPHVEHEFVMLEDSVALDIFAPRRDDWIAAASREKAAVASNETDAAALVALQETWVTAEIASFSIVADDMIIDGDTAVVVSRIGGKTKIVWTAIKRGGAWRGLAQTFSKIEPEK